MVSVCALSHSSCPYLQEKSDVEPDLPPALSAARTALYNLAGELAELQGAAGLLVSAEEYIKEVLHPGLMQVNGL